MIQKKALQAGFWTAAVATADLLAPGGAVLGTDMDMYDGQWRNSLSWITA